ncbi:unnamed protein product [Symbiodinium necroappetens]|uniref:Uncharacterized protein n=1 Tax=Symbiodinium necroappetens TaxID=1628268 RepID=A0A812YG39_9DINO|nr:unnamed protein product [Symbiodinium necroappetens]
MNLSEVEELCEAAAYFMDTELAHTVASQRNLDAWNEVCREVFDNLSFEAQQLLREMRSSGRHRKELTDWEIDGRSGRWKQQVIASVTNGTLKEKAELPEFVPLHQIPMAFKEARVLRFNGRKLLPDSMFNATLAGIERLHPDSADSTFMFGSFDLGGSVCRILMLLPLTRDEVRYGDAGIKGRTGTELTAAEACEALRRKGAAVPQGCPAAPLALQAWMSAGAYEVDRQAAQAQPQEAADQRARRKAVLLEFLRNTEPEVAAAVGLLPIPAEDKLQNCRALAVSKAAYGWIARLPTLQDTHGLAATVRRAMDTAKGASKWSRAAVYGGTTHLDCISGTKLACNAQRWMLNPAAAPPWNGGYGTVAYTLRKWLRNRGWDGAILLSELHMSVPVSMVISWFPTTLTTMRASP